MILLQNNCFTLAQGLAYTRGQYPWTRTRQRSILTCEFAFGNFKANVPINCHFCLQINICLMQIPSLRCSPIKGKGQLIIRASSDEKWYSLPVYLLEASSMEDVECLIDFTQSKPSVKHAQVSRRLCSKPVWWVVALYNIIKFYIPCRYTFSNLFTNQQPAVNSKKSMHTMIIVLGREQQSTPFVPLLRCTVLSFILK